MTKEREAQVQEWANKQNTFPTLIVAHLVTIANRVLSQITQEELEALIQEEYKKEMEREKEEQEEKKNKTTFHINPLSASFTEALYRGAYDLAHLDYDLECDIIKKYL